MSGIVGIVQFDGSAVEPRLLCGLTNYLAFRGPDAQRTWIKGSVGFGHTLFKTTEEPEHDCQPLTLDNNTWIVADARIDAREELIAKLKNGEDADGTQSNCTDAELILRAYTRWGTVCVEHLLGDFAFAIWDDTRQELFCARDHMGVKPFFYSQAGSCVIFSNTLDCLRKHPLVSDRLNDLAVGDFLLFGHNQDPATTSFADIQRLPPAHCRVWSADTSKTYRYWSMPIDEPLSYKRPGDYIDQFHDLLRNSVGDRLRTRQIWVFMSGGMDSPTLAAMARDLIRERFATFDLRALTNVDSFVPDEARFAHAAAEHLGMPIHYRPWTQNADSRWEQIPFSIPEPDPHAWMVPAEGNFWRAMESHSRVFFFGEGPDNALRCDWKPYLSYLSRKRNYRQLLRSIIPTLLAEKRPPFWGRISRRFERGALRAKNGGLTYPEWFNASFESRLDLRARWTGFRSDVASVHPYRPAAYKSLQIPLWQAMFESFDPGVTKNLFEVRHPFVDIRLLRFLLAVPSLPWCRSKYLLRKAMRDRLPPELLWRRKAIVHGYPMQEFLMKLCPPEFAVSREISAFIDPRRFPAVPVRHDVESNLRVRSLNHWLQNSHRISHNPEERIS